MKRYGLICIAVLLGAMCVIASTSPCADCHEEIAASTATAIHLRVAGLTCETCHINAENHMETGETEGLISEHPQKQCFSCHTDLTCDGTHCGRDTFTCNSCHCIHHGKGAAMLTGGETKVCQSCHKDVMAEMHMPNHHPVPEGKMTCGSCHSPHGDYKPSESTAKDVNDLCLTCHSAYQGPFIFEHSPVVEDCRICHNAHGSVADNLLVQTEPFLCLQCHEFHFHTGLEADTTEVVDVGGTEFANPYGQDGFKMAYGTKCTQCHSQIHGSDLPSQTVPGQGKGLIR